MKQLTVVLQIRLETLETRMPRLRSQSIVLAASQVQMHVTWAVGGAEPDLVAEYGTVGSRQFSSAQRRTRITPGKNVARYRTPNDDVVSKA